jgi:hypothetical protein
MSAIIPIPRVAISIRPGVLGDLSFLDSLQKLHTKQVGWMPTAQFEGKIKLGHVLIAEDETKRPVGYCIGNDQYFKRDDLGIIYQMNVMPGRQRALIGVSLLKAQFERSAYGCRLYCCWCAQDIEANRFWEACGFVPLAFRTGSRTKGANGSPRVHIFWQKRIREGDTTTPWWFPSQTTSGAIREDRLVFPIPPGVRWNDPMPVVLPAHERQLDATKVKRIAGPKQPRAKAQPIGGKTIGFGFLRFADPVPPKAEKPKRAKKPKVKNDPKFVAAARELRDRWLEKVNEDPTLLTSQGKYDVGRLPDPQAVALKQLPQAA